MVRRDRPLLLLRLALLLGASAAVAAGQDWRYRDQRDGTVLATQTELLWLGGVNCWKAMSWGEAKAAVARLQDGMCGLTDGSKPGDWRLPTQKEFRMMIECSCGGITLTDDQGTGCYASGGSTFRGVQPRGYWSSTELSRGGESVRVVMSLHDGFDRAAAAGKPFLVWPVRRASASEPLKEFGFRNPEVET